MISSLSRLPCTYINLRVRRGIQFPPCTRTLSLLLTSHISNYYASVHNSVCYSSIVVACLRTSSLFVVSFAVVRHRS